MLGNVLDEFHSEGGLFKLPEVNLVVLVEVSYGLFLRGLVEGHIASFEGSENVKGNLGENFRHDIEKLSICFINMVEEHDQPE